MLIGGADPMQYLAKYRDRYSSFPLKDVVPDRSSDIELGRGTFDFRRFLAAVPAIETKPSYVEQEAATDEMASAKANWAYLHQLEF